MKRALFAVAAAGMTSVAAAQSSVTLYGTVDTGLTYLNNVGGHSLWEMEGGNLGESKFGFLGSEDLGGGLKATFQLENGFNSANGRLSEGGLLFGRMATVGLASDKWGTFTAGRQNDSLSDALGPFGSCWNWSGYGYHFGDNDNLCQFTHYSNLVRYTTPTFAGVTIGGTYGFGGQPGDFTHNQLWAVAATYSSGPVNLGAGYFRVNNPGSPSGPFDSAGISTAFTNPGADNYSSAMSGNYVGIQDAGSWKVAGVGGSYTIGDLVLSAVYTNSRYSDSRYLIDTGSGDSKTDVVFNNVEVSAMYNVTPAWSVDASYQYTHASVTAVDRKGLFHTISLGTGYALSKRTSLYALVNYQLARGDGIYASDGTFGANAAIQGVSSNGQQVNATVGIRHSF